ncbi:MAG: hypothetical protein M0035_04990 [Actinomycetota bacterium]|nr:hypothetical protein [Actinomycetota bacterium]
MARASGRRERSVESVFVRFATTQGLAPEPSHEMIEAFCAEGLAQATCATRGTYRSVLRKRAGLVLPVFRPHYRGAAAKAPYSPEERAKLVSIASLQPRAWRGEAALVLIALGIGAGMRAGEIVAAATADLSVETAQVVVAVRGGRTRRVRVEAPFADIVAGLGRGCPDAYLFRPHGTGRSHPNFVNDLCRSLVRDPDAPRLSLARCRASYVCERLATRTPLSEILASTGIAEVESLLRYAVHVEGAPKTKAQLRQRLADGQ